MEKVGLTVKKIPDSDRDPDHHKIERFVASETSRPYKNFIKIHHILQLPPKFVQLSLSCKGNNIPLRRNSDHHQSSNPFSVIKIR